MREVAGLQHTIKAYIYRGESEYVAECMGISVVTQGRSLDETIANLQEAVALHLDGEDLSELGLTDDPTLLVTLELEPRPRVAEAEASLRPGSNSNPGIIRLRRR